MSLLHLDKGTAGDRTQRGVVLVSSLLIAGMFVSCIAFGLSVPDESVSGFSARLPAAESSIVASDGAGVACALGTAASSATAKARTKRDSDIGPIPTLVDGNGP